jgi:probable non-F420 flavinoid oxidoreductase
MQRMPVIGFHASHEQIDPRSLLDAVRAAEAAGFQAAMCSDHFAPWSTRQGESGFAWSWLGAALHATSFSFGVVNAPGQRYHPAIIAQAAATLAHMFFGRFWVALGSGEAMNEHITGEPWPVKSVRNARLRECVDVMRAMFAGETVSHRGLVQVDRARLWTRPETPPPLIGAAVSEATAAWVGDWADGLVTINQPRDKLKRMIGAFRENGGEGKPLFLQIHVAYARDEDAALAVAHDQWRTNIFPPSLCWDLELPEMFEDAARFVRPEDLKGPVLVSADPDRFAGWLAEFAELGFERIYVHHVGKEQRAFIDAFGERVLPIFAGSAS